MDLTRQSYESKKSVDRHDTTELRAGEEYIVRIMNANEGKVLDIGCGTGRFTAYLKNGVGIDYADAMIERAKLRYPMIPFHKMDVRRMAFKDKSFDGAVFTFFGLDMLYPERDRSLALTEIRRVLKPGSYFAFATHTHTERPNLLSGRKFVKKLLGWAATLWLRLPPQYFASWNGGGFYITHMASLAFQARTLKAHGFDVIDTTPIKGGHMIVCRV